MRIQLQSILFPLRPTLILSSGEFPVKGGSNGRARFYMHTAIMGALVSH